MIGRGNATLPVPSGGKHTGHGVVPIRPEVMAAIMNDPAAAGLPAKREPFHPSQCSRVLGYRVGQESVPVCPGCGRTHWLVGRSTAECAFCATALPLIG
jgi:hypothetical protein